MLRFLQRVTVQVQLRRSSSDFFLGKLCSSAFGQIFQIGLYCFRQFVYGFVAGQDNAIFRCTHKKLRGNIQQLIRHAESLSISVIFRSKLSQLRIMHIELNDALFRQFQQFNAHLSEKAQVKRAFTASGLINRHAAVAAFVIQKTHDFHGLLFLFRHNRHAGYQQHNCQHKSEPSAHMSCLQIR